MASNGSTVVEHLPHYYKVEGSSPATAANTERENRKKTIQDLFVASNCSTEVEQLPHHSKVQGSSPTTEASSGPENGIKQELFVTSGGSTVVEHKLMNSRSRV